MSHSAKHSHLSPDRLIRSDTNWNVLTRTEKRQAWLQNRVPRVQVLLPLPNLNGTIDTKVVPFFYTHKMPKIRTFCYEKKHLKNGFPFLWRAEIKQRNE